MGTDKQKARQLAVAWWNSDKSTKARARGYGICDSCNASIPLRMGYLCNPAVVGIPGLPSAVFNSPDHICESCFDRGSYEPWNPEHTARMTTKAQAAWDERQTARPQAQATSSARYMPRSEEEERTARAKAEQAAALRREREVEQDIRSLTHTDSKVRRAAADRLGEVQETRALNPLLHVLNQDVEPGCRAVAAWALGRLGNPSAVEALNRSALEDPDEQVRREASAALNRIKETRSIRSTPEVRENRQQSERKWWQFWRWRIGV